MQRFTSLPRSVLKLLAVFYAICAVGYIAVGTYQAQVAPAGDPGFSGSYNPSTGVFEVAHLRSGGPAEQAGLRVGDRVLGIDGRPATGLAFYKLTMSGRINQVQSYTVQRGGRQLENAEQLTLRLTLGSPWAPAFANVTRTQHIVGIIVQQGYFFLLLTVALSVLFLRITDPNAWLLALCFTSFAASAPIFVEVFAGVRPFEGLIRPGFLRAAFVSYETVGWGLGPVLFNYFFSVFPNRSPIDRWLPWLKSTLLAFSAAIVICLWLVSAKAGFVPAFAVVSWLGATSRFIVIFPIIALGSLLCGLLSLVLNSIFPPSLEARRKTRVMIWGTVAAVLPTFVISLPTLFSGAPPHLSVSMFLIIGLLGCLMPLSFAYAVAKHRVLEIPVLLRMSARYLLVRRGFAVFLVLLFLLANALFTFTYLRFFKSINAGYAIAMGVSFGALLLWVSAPIIRRATRKIDRAFFRSDYDARHILESLAHKTRKATQREQLAELLEGEINQALRPTILAIYLRDNDQRLTLYRGATQLGLARVLSPTEPWLQALERRDEPSEVVSSSSTDRAEPSQNGPRPECLVPMMRNDGHLAGVILLGTRLSEQPYSGEDKRLLASVASQAELALEGIARGEEIAQRIEADRRAAQEMEFASQVQARLFPQKLPVLRTLQYIGACIQARQVGGDYYDFLESHPGQLALVLADVSGKGISGALMMANLQANLRSQYATALEDPRRLLSSVNHLFYENTEEGSYATLFFATYEDSSRRFHYVNCGHLPALIVRANAPVDSEPPGSNSSMCAVERLSSTSTVLGLFENWEASTAETRLSPGDTVVLYTDGVTEAMNQDGEEFGESRLIDVLKMHLSLPLKALLESIVGAVQNFSGGEQTDDITVIVARCVS
jgi:serine phosphatase RsbU (regulator of sigma subunit)